MRNKPQIRLWRVDWCHISGFHAPSMYVEAENYNKAHRMVRDEKCRLADFPQWSFTLNKLDLEKVNGKWLTPIPQEEE